MTSSITLTPDLAEKLGLAEGDSFKICIEGTVRSANEQGLSGDVTDAYNEEAEETAEEEPAEEAPAATPKSAGKSKAAQLMESEQE